MLERQAHQASGLLGLAPPAETRLLALVSHGDASAELPLLWRLCSTLVNYGYSVTVFDATSTETENNPGLLHHLQGQAALSNPGSEGLAWQIWPAARGIQALCAQPQRRQHHLHQLCATQAGEGLIILYSQAEAIAQLLGDTDVVPLLPISATQSALMSSYLALKRLRSKGKMQPHIVYQRTASGDLAHTVMDNLSGCAKTFLDYDVKAIAITSFNDDGPPHNDVQHLALRWLESAFTPAPAFKHSTEHELRSSPATRSH